MYQNDAFFPYLGFGLGLRIPHYTHIFEHWPQVDWFEIISENFIDTDGRPKRNLARIRERYPVVMHGVALSIGTVDPLNSEYLHKLRKLMDWLKPAWVSDHLCWTGIAHKNSHDLLPVPYTEEALKHIVNRIKQVQDVLERPIALENPSTYLEFKSSSIPEAEFIARMAIESGCHLLLDVNNVYVSCYNHRLDAKNYIDTLPLDKVAQIHLSGHSNKGTHIIDTHDDHVIDEVWALYRYVTHKAGRIYNTMVEWDDKIPSFEVVYQELEKAKTAAQQAADYGMLPDLAKPHTPYVANHITTLELEQRRMQEAILLGAAINTYPNEWIPAKENFSPSEQLKVYINSYRYRLYDVTAEDYPVLRFYLGDDRFERLITDFVNGEVSEHFNICRYTAQLLNFLKSHDSRDSVAIELAMLEGAIAQLSDPEETSPLEPSHLEGMDADQLMDTSLHPRKALALFAFDYPVNRYYRAVKEETNLPSLAPQAEYIAVFRHEDVVWRMELDELEYHLLQILFMGVPVGRALETLHRERNVDEEVLVTHLSSWFARWMRNRLLAYYPYQSGGLEAA
jgi:uncharacterized protein (UPF0276 family)